MPVCSKSIPGALLSFTFFKVTGMVGEVTRQGMTSSLPSFMNMTLGISLCISKKGLPVSEWEENKKIHIHVNGEVTDIRALQLERLMCSCDLGEGTV